MNNDIIKTIRQAREALIRHSPVRYDRVNRPDAVLGFIEPECIEAITNLLAAIEVAENQEPIYQWMDTRSNTKVWTDSPLHHYKEWKQYPYYEWRVLYTNPVSTKPESKHWKEAAESLGAECDTLKDWQNEASSVLAQFINLTANPLEDEWGEVAAEGIRLLNEVTKSEGDCCDTNLA